MRWAIRKRRVSRFNVHGADLKVDSNAVLTNAQARLWDEFPSTLFTVSLRLVRMKLAYSRSHTSIGT
eukprot:1683843-Prymnesium_polylepis.1